MVLSIVRVSLFPHLRQVQMMCYTLARAHLSYSPLYLLILATCL